MPSYNRYKRHHKQAHLHSVKQLLTLPEAKKKLMDFVARRDHTEKELAKKLARYCDAETIQKTLDWATKQNWLASPEKLRTQFVTQLERRGKGIRQINQKLKELGLDSVKSDKNSELKKAKKLVLTKWSIDCFRGLDYKEIQKLKAQISRFLISRGYESDTINLILNKELKKSSGYLIGAFDDQEKIGEDVYDDEF